MKYPILSIAGFDPSGGAGILADVKTFSALGCYGMAVNTALTVQNTQGVYGVAEIDTDHIISAIDKIFDDIPPAAIKIGMLFNDKIIMAVAKSLHKNLKNKQIPLVLDPVMRAKGGDSLLAEKSVQALQTIILPMADIITPNLREAETLLGCPTIDAESMPARAEELLKLGAKSVLLKGGHLTNDTADDYLLLSSGGLWLKAPRIATKHTHGTGCTLSSAIAGYLGRGETMMDAVKMAKNYVHGAIEAVAKDGSIGQGIGPLHHFYQFSVF